ncbi:MAG: hypothetical protein IJ060_01205 [Oscillospiraceae bacterium]|nr:hypothetical protein [Oscillospiraceae bacterium]
MKKKIQRLITFAASAGASLLLAAGSTLHAGASGSVEDVYNAMRRIGMPESMVQDAKTQFQNTSHDAEGMTINNTYYTYDIWADMVEIYQDDIWDEVAKQFDLTGDQLKKSYETATVPPTTGTDAQGTGSSATTATTAITTTQPSVTTDKPFTSMTLDEKKAYVASLPEEERAAFVAGLSTSERNSIIKQMDPDAQANVMQGFIQAGEQLGMHVSVDSIGGGNGISYSVRNSDGTLIDSASLGGGVDETGWDLTVPVLVSAGAVLLSAGGFVWIALLGRKHREEDAQ